MERRHTRLAVAELPLLEQECVRSYRSTMQKFPNWDPVAFPGKGDESMEERADGELSIYRNWIERRWDNDIPGYILWIMFNPSVATIESDGADRASPLCFQRSQRIALNRTLPVGAMRIVNLFARRSKETKNRRVAEGSGA
jgi:Protein of unknown function (DUF1643)